MSNKRDELAKIISQLKGQVKEALNQNESTKEAIAQQVTDLQSKVSELQNRANTALDDDAKMLQSLDEQLVQCSSLLESSTLVGDTERDIGGTTTDAEVCTSPEQPDHFEENFDRGDSTSRSNSNVSKSKYSDNTPGSEDLQLSSSQTRGTSNVEQNRLLVKKKYSPVKEKSRHLLTWNRVKLSQRQTYHEDDDGKILNDIEEVKTDAIDGYGENYERFKYPYLLANGPKDELIVSDRDSHQLIVFNNELQFLHAFGSRGKDLGNGTFYNPSGLAVDKIGSFLYVADQNNLIQRFKMNENSTCQFISQFGGKGIGKGQFNCPQGLLFTQSEQLFACDYRNHRVQVFNKEGKFLHAFGRHGIKPGEFSEPHSITINHSQDKIFITDHSNNRIQIFSPHGKFLAVISNSPSLKLQLQYPRGIFYTDNGHLLISCTYTHCILELKEDGSYTSTIEEIIQPCGVVLRYNRDIVVTSNVNQSLVVVRSCKTDS